MRFIVQILVNTLAIFVADYLIKGIIFEGDLLTLFIAGFLLGLINFIIKPILKLISAPLIVLTLGLFTIIINIVLLWLLEYFVPELTIVGFWSYFWGVLIISLVNMFFGTGRKKKD
ncbi:MAG: phage holin family protein [Patescibacteria group bacterium]